MSGAREMANALEASRRDMIRDALGGDEFVGSYFDEHPDWDVWEPDPLQEAEGDAEAVRIGIALGLIAVVAIWTVQTFAPVVSAWWSTVS